MSDEQFLAIMGALISIAVYSGWSASKLITLSTKVRALEEIVRLMRK